MLVRRATIERRLPDAYVPVVPTSPIADRAYRLATLASEDFDLLVVGGGITGAGIARDAALRGLRVALVEKDDFASGTSSRSSRLVHGGLRYLEHGQLHLVFESSMERRRLLQIAPHLVHPLSFLWPVYQGARVPRWKLAAGLLLYDALALFRNVGWHHSLGREQVAALEPALRRDGLRGGARYYDAATNDARLTLANALGAAQLGAVVLNHAEVRRLRVVRGRAAGAVVVDGIGGQEVEVRARVVVNATGPWSDLVRDLEPDARTRGRRPAVRGSKGVHIELPRERVGNHGALTVTSPRDGRVMFILPAGQHTIVGTTDTYTDATPDEVRASDEDVEYLLDAANAYFPAARLTADDVVSAWAGIRPLMATSTDDPGSASREHAITRSPSGVIAITGGKLTTFRVMAAQVMDAVQRALGRPVDRPPTKRRPLPGGDVDVGAATSEAARATGDEALAAHLVGAYGSRWTAVWEEIRRGAGGAERLVLGLPYTIGEMRYAVREEMACTLADLLVRRTHLAFETRDHGTAVAGRVAAAVRDLLDWSPARAAREVEHFSDEAERIFGREEAQSPAGSRMS